NFIGPFVGAVAVSAIGLDGAYYVHILLAVAGWVVLVVVPDPQTPSPPAPHGGLNPVTIARRNSGVLRTAGVGIVAIGAMRAMRQVVIPLWADHIGLDAATVGVVFGISAAMDMTLFYPAGVVSDRWGRKLV